MEVIIPLIGEIRISLPAAILIKPDITKWFISESSTVCKITHGHTDLVTLKSSVNITVQDKNVVKATTT